ncbi:MAG: glutathione peroxidase [Bacteroidetes bacterium]|nr:glutathione peroxidase [Bacteroidota bacterium]
MNLYDIPVTDISGRVNNLAEYKGKVLLIVNVASQCGFTPQYEGLQKLYEEKREDGFDILGFPCNQFGEQEKGSDSEIENFCKVNFGVTFPLFAKIDVNGANENPLFKILKSEAPGFLGTKKIKWNFTKFLVDRNGKVIGRFSPSTKPEKLKEKIEELLAGGESR